MPDLTDPVNFCAEETGLNLNAHHANLGKTCRTIASSNCDFPALSVALGAKKKKKKKKKKKGQTKNHRFQINPKKLKKQILLQGLYPQKKKKNGTPDNQLLQM